MRNLFILLSALVLASCASLSEEECKTGNWDEIGFRDGTNGRTSAYIQEHAKACEKSGVAPIQSVWEAGRQRGLPAYCVPSKAYSEGRAGRPVSAVCPAGQMEELRAANDTGQQYRRYTNDLNAAKARLSEVEQQLLFEDSFALRFHLFRESRTLEQNIRLLEDKRRQFETF